MTIECSICAHNFDATARKPLIGICGHTFCASCVATLKNRKAGCPACRRHDSFTSPMKCTTNFVLLECIETMSKLTNLHEKECTDLKQNIAALETVEVDLEAEKRRARAAIETVNEMAAVVDELNREKELLYSTSWVCSACDTRVEHSRTRICIDCCEGIALNGFDISIVDIAKADASVLCSFCFYEGLHELHVGVPYLKMRIRHFTLESFACIDSQLTENIGSKIHGTFSNISEACTLFSTMMSKRRDEAAAQKSISDFEKYLEATRAICTSFDRITDDFVSQSANIVSRVKQIMEDIVQ